MIDVMFSLPIFERLDVVLDTILNFRAYNPNCGIVIHVSPVFDIDSYNENGLTYAKFKKIIAELGNVFINPQRVRTGRYDIIQAFISNFRAVEHIDFSYWAMTASNELFVREGLIDAMLDFDAGLDCNIVDKRPKWGTGQSALNDPVLKKMLTGSEPRVIGSQIEGQFYKKEVFADICDIIEREYDYHEMTAAYAREEIYFSSVYWTLQSERGYKTALKRMFTFVPWHRQYTTRVRPQEIKCIREGGQYYSIKRVDRDLDDPVRKFVRKIGGYEADLRQLIPWTKPYTTPAKENTRWLWSEIKVYINVLRKTGRFVSQGRYSLKKLMSMVIRQIQISSNKKSIA